ncbi:ABC transporter permease [Brevibacterium senegalense]|uniref:ABC transporter permease n=1 Tax=Brevibacterium senegalense TaxID=1033736 RepID=UPI0002F7B755|nr:ABC transporter permease [Brevibacterium senegalense]
MTASAATAAAAGTGLDTALILTRVGEHLAYSGLAVGIAVLLAVPAGLLIGHAGRGAWMIAGANALRALPSLGLMTLLVLLLGAGLIPPTIALVLLAIPPVLSHTAAGIATADRAAVDAAYAMGMTGRQVLLQVRIPVALPLMVAGLRSAVLQVVATATIAAFVNLGGIGRFIFDGLAVRDYDRVVLGAVLVAGLALVLDGLLALVARATAPGRVRGLRARSPQGSARP